jgi:hypothetical protein
MIPAPGKKRLSRQKYVSGAAPPGRCGSGERGRDPDGGPRRRNRLRESGAVYVQKGDSTKRAVPLFRYAQTRKMPEMILIIYAKQDRT